MRIATFVLAGAAAMLAACMDHGAHGADHDDADSSTHGGHDSDGGHTGAPVPEVLEQPPTEGRFDTTTAADLDAAPDVVEVTLEAKQADVEVVPGKKVRMWTYGGTLPGPTIEAKVGDTVRVRVTNSLPEATTVHWHGLRLPAAMDGVPALQKPIEPGATFTYEFKVTDAGTFWYHPHVRSDEQVERGLYGAIVVRDSAEPATTTDRVVVLDDLLVDESFQLAPFSVEEAMVGRQGNLILVNGRAHPIADAAPNGLHRFRFVNAANARYFRLAFGDDTLVWIGSDGGRFNAPRKVTEIMLVPGQRADVLVHAGQQVDVSRAFSTLAYERGHGTGRAPDARVFTLRTRGDAVAAMSVPETLASVVALPEATVTRTITLEESEHGAGAHAGHGGASAEVMGPVFSLNGATYPDITPFEAKLDAVEEWSLENTTQMDHPFHLHGFRFQVVSDAMGKPILEWRDTLNVPALTTVRIRMRLEDHPGTWMFHCHILEHAERGMMGELHVAE